MSATSHLPWRAQQAMARAKSMSSTTRPRSNSSASAEPGAREVIASGVDVSIPVRLDVEQRIGAEHARRVRRGRRMQEGLVEPGKRGHAKQAERADHFVLEQLQ